MSHDRVTRLLQGDWSGQTRLERPFRTLFVWERGDLILDAPVIPKPFATAMESLAWVFSSQQRKPVYGFSLVLLIWTKGTLRIPLSIRLWQKGAERGTIELPMGLRAPQRCPPSPAVSPRVWAL